jgi:hypothetical protein
LALCDFYPRAFSKSTRRISSDQGLTGKLSPKIACASAAFLTI